MCELPISTPKRFICETCHSVWRLRDLPQLQNFLCDFEVVANKRSSSEGLKGKMGPEESPGSLLKARDWRICGPFVALQVGNLHTMTVSTLAF